MVTVYCRHGHVIAMHPAPQKSYYESRQQIYECDVIVSDGEKYDLSQKGQVYSIPIPEYNLADKQNRVSEELGASGYIEYVLRMKASQYKNLGNNSLAYACLGQAMKLMLFSDMMWPEKEYWRIVDWLEKDGRFQLAARWEDWIHEHVPTLENLAADNFRKTVESCYELGTGLIKLSWNGAQSATVAKYQGRVYSLPGVKSKFPVLPEFILEQGYICKNGLSRAFPFRFWNDPELDTINYKGKNCPALRTSWRPFVDDRSPEEKQNYYNLQQQLLESKHKEKNRRAYIRLRYAFPNICPERLSTFYSWQRTHPDRYEQIVNSALASGLVVPTKELVMPSDIEPPDPDPSYRGGRIKPLFL